MLNKLFNVSKVYPIISAVFIYGRVIYYGNTYLMIEYELIPNQQLYLQNMIMHYILLPKFKYISNL